ncbi:MAG: c-type cytochrome [Anaerolineales bacterium]|nr:c-type cytochrome [Anaerolineales bacterium]
MRKFIVIELSLFLAFLGLLGLSHPAGASAEIQADDPIARGRYLASISGCTSCHTPDTSEYQNPQTLTLEQIQVIAFDGNQALDEAKFMAGGRAFDLGPAGVVYSRNITQDEETGIGAWSDEQIKIAIKTGLSANGEILFPVMPYHVYNGMADEDVNAIVAFLRTVRAIKNEVPQRTVITDGLAALPYQEGVSLPDPVNSPALGAYLVNHVMGCTDCHTPVDPNTGAPLMEKYLAGRQPYEGPWGIVYGGNITPDEETGIGSWTNEEVKRSIITGIGRDGRRLILMPWYAYSSLTPQDADAVASFLKNDLPAVNNEIPAPSLNPEFMVMSPAENAASNSGLDLNSPIILVVVGVVIVALVSLGMFMLRRKNG